MEGGGEKADEKIMTDCRRIICVKKYIYYDA